MTPAHPQRPRRRRTRVDTRPPAEAKAPPDSSTLPASELTRRAAAAKAELAAAQSELAALAELGGLAYLHAARKLFDADADAPVRLFFDFLLEPFNTNADSPVHFERCALGV